MMTPAVLVTHPRSTPIAPHYLVKVTNLDGETRETMEIFGSHISLEVAQAIAIESICLTYKNVSSFELDENGNSNKGKCEVVRGEHTGQFLFQHERNHHITVHCPNGDAFVIEELEVRTHVDHL